MMKFSKYFGSMLTFLYLIACKTDTKKTHAIFKNEEVNFVKNLPEGMSTPEGMIWIPGGEFHQGALEHDEHAMKHERPRHKVVLDGFFMDIHPVTNADFKSFVNETGYITVAEREVDWKEMKKQLPPGTTKPHDSILKPGSLVFKKTKNSVPNLYDYSQWWDWQIGANWRNPNGPESSIHGKDDYPVVQIAFEDALAYCKWSGSRLPTEAEWEYAARGKNKESIYFWGDGHEKLKDYANTWEGEFPVKNTKADGYELRAPVLTYPKNGFGLYGMAGNVWEWTSDWYNMDYYEEISKIRGVKNPKGAKKPYNPLNPYEKEKVIKGGSFLCSASYCANYRISARMATSLDSGLEHLGFRTVKSNSD